MGPISRKEAGLNKSGFQARDFALVCLSWSTSSVDALTYVINMVTSSEERVTETEETENDEE